MTVIQALVLIIEPWAKGRVPLSANTLSFGNCSKTLFLSVSIKVTTVFPELSCN